MSYIGNTFTTQAFTPAVDFFNGNGSTVAFTLSRPVASVAQVQAVISNVPQKPGDAFTVSGNTITFTSAPPSGTQNIYVYYTSPITQVIAPGQGTVGTTQIQDNAITTAKIAAGAVIPADLSTGAPAWDTSGNIALNGATPSAWLGFKATQVQQGVMASNQFSAGNLQTFLGSNVYYDGAYRYLVSGSAAARYAMNEGAHILFSAPSGTAGSAITFIQLLQVDTNSSLALQGATSQSGTGITFPATQSASSNANTLDDYEEGSWTPTLVSTGATFTYSASTGGTYVKIGRLVLLSGVVTLTSKSGGTAGNAVGVGGIPFAAGAPDSSGSGQGLVFTAGIGGLTVPANYGTPNGAVCTPNTASAYPLMTSTNGAAATVITYSAISSTAYMQFSMTYYANA